MSARHERDDGDADDPRRDAPAAGAALREPPRGASSRLGSTLSSGCGVRRRPCGPPTISARTGRSRIGRTSAGLSDSGRYVNSFPPALPGPCGPCRVARTPVAARPPDPSSRQPEHPPDRRMPEANRRPSFHTRGCSVACAHSIAERTDASRTGRTNHAIVVVGAGRSHADERATCPVTRIAPVEHPLSGGITGSHVEVVISHRAAACAGSQ